jgi:hypothetical protein
MIASSPDLSLTAVRRAGVASLTASHGAGDRTAGIHQPSLAGGETPDHNEDPPQLQHEQTTVRSLYAITARPRLMQSTSVYTIGGKMRLRWSRQLRHVIMSIALFGITGLLAATVGPLGVGASIACGCEGAGGGSITAKPNPAEANTNSSQMGAGIGYVNNTGSGWTPKTDNLKIIKGPSNIWGRSGDCVSNTISSPGLCEEEIKITAPKENEWYEADYELEGAPTVLVKFYWK